MFEKFLAAIAALTEALIANTAALGGKAPAKGGDDAEEKKTTTRSRASSKNNDDEPEEKKTTSRAKKVTREDVTALLNKVKEDLGAPVAKKLIKDVGEAERLAEVDDDLLEALFKAANKKLDAADAGGKGGDDDNL
jgi:hypothetical protein